MSYFFTKKKKNPLNYSVEGLLLSHPLPILLPPFSQVFTLLNLVCVLPSQDFVVYCL